VAPPRSRAGRLVVDARRRLGDRGDGHGGVRDGTAGGPLSGRVVLRPARVALSGRPGAVVMVLAVVVAAAVVWSGIVDQISVDAGGLVSAVVAVAAVGLGVGVVGRPRRWWATWGVGIAVSATVVVASARWWILDSGLVSEHYPPTFLLWVWLGLWAVGVAGTGWWSGGAAVRMARAVAAPLVVVAAFLLVNAHYGYWPTVGVLLGRPVTGQVSASRVYQEISLRTRSSMLVNMHAQVSSPSTGLYGPISIPATPVHFDADLAWLWLPPVYFHSSRAQIPVLIMLTGLPGEAQDWVTAGQVVPLADRWARAHHGVAPVMIFVDENGRGDRDTECVNGPHGAAQSYLTRDLPDWVEGTLGIHPDPRTWGVVGFSEGGTCAVGLAAEDPGLFGYFVDVGGDMAPNLGGPATTLRNLYAGNAAAAESFEPKAIFVTHHFGHLEGWFAAGGGDRNGLGVALTLAGLAAHAGVDTHIYDGPGGHTWLFARRALSNIYPTLATALSSQVQRASS
jgi:S-formylglutathione hydrolase FrmB